MAIGAGAILGGGAALGGVSGYLANRAGRKQTKAQQEAIENAIEYLQQAARQPYSDVFGNVAGPNGMAQPAGLREAAQEALARNLAAQRINNARALQTDHDAQAAYNLQNSRLANAYANQSGNAAMIAALRNRANLNNIGKNVANVGVNANNVINAASQGIKNNNIGQIGQDTQLNGLGASYVNSANNVNNAYQQRNSAYNGAIAQLMGNMPTNDGYSGFGSALQSAIGAVTPMAGSYLQGLAGNNKTTGGNSVTG